MFWRRNNANTFEFISIYEANMLKNVFSSLICMIQKEKFLHFSKLKFRMTATWNFLPKKTSAGIATEVFLYIQLVRLLTFDVRQKSF